MFLSDKFSQLFDLLESSATRTFTLDDDVDRVRTYDCFQSSDHIRICKDLRTFGKQFLYVCPCINVEWFPIHAVCSQNIFILFTFLRLFHLSHLILSLICRSIPILIHPFWKYACCTIRTCP